MVLRHKQYCYSYSSYICQLTLQGNIVLRSSIAHDSKRIVSYMMVKQSMTKHGVVLLHATVAFLSVAHCRFCLVEVSGEWKIIVYGVLALGSGPTHLSGHKGHTPHWHHLQDPASPHLVISLLPLLPYETSTTEWNSYSTFAPAVFF